MIDINLQAFDPFALVTLILLVVAIPLVGIKELALLRRWIRAGHENARLRFYRWIIGLEWTLTAGLGYWWFAMGRPAGDLGLIPAVHEWQWILVVAGLLGSYLIIIQMNMALESNEQLRKVRDEMASLWHLAPRNNREQTVFMQVSFTAGICEEILYRGFLMHILTQFAGTWPAMILTAVIFGLGHIYQGREGLLKTSGLGLAFGLLAHFSGSLYVGMVLHAVMDLSSGRILQAAINLDRR